MAFLENMNFKGGLDLVFAVISGNDSLLIALDLGVRIRFHTVTRLIIKVVNLGTFDNPIFQKVLQN